jgi:hypothetical protein
MADWLRIRQYNWLDCGVARLTDDLYGVGCAEKDTSRRS